jgi:hypothetical protein
LLVAAWLPRKNTSVEYAVLVSRTNTHYSMVKNPQIEEVILGEQIFFIPRVQFLVHWVLGLALSLLDFDVRVHSPTRSDSVDVAKAHSVFPYSHVGNRGCFSVSSPV